MTETAEVGLITVCTASVQTCRNPAILDELFLITNDSLQQIYLQNEDTHFHAISEITELQSCKLKATELYQLWINVKESVLEGNAFSTLVYPLQSNVKYRDSFLVQLRYHSSALTYGKMAIPCMKIKVVMPKKSDIAYKSQALASKTLWERIELEDAIHWLSTLGGAYSNLGEHSLAFAHLACDNAFRQMKIALRSDDPFVIYRCWLYVAMSSMQQGHLSQSRRIIEHTYQKFSYNENGRRIEHQKIKNMCLGIWARLKYVWNSRSKRRKRTSSNNKNGVIL